MDFKQKGRIANRESPMIRTTRMVGVVLTLSLLGLLVSVVQPGQAAQSQQSVSVSVDFETPDIGSSEGRIIEPYTSDPSDSPQVSFSVAQNTSGDYSDRAVGLTTQGSTSACVDSEPRDDQVLGIGTSGDDSSVGISHAPVEAGFNRPVQASASTPVTFEADVQSAVGNTAVLELLDSHGAVIASGTGIISQPGSTCSFPGPNRSTIRVSATADRTVVAAQIRLQGNSPDGGSVWVMDDFTIETQGSGSSSTACPGGLCGTISYGDTVTGSLAANSIPNQDTWEFTGSDGDVVTVDLTSPDFDPVLTLTDSSGQQEYARNDDRGDGSLNSRIANFTLPSQGTYAINVGKFNQSGSGSYTLSLSRSGSGGSSNNVISYGETVSGMIEPVLSASVPPMIWEFQGSDGDVVTIDLTSPDFDPMLTLIGPSGQQVASNDDQGDGSLNSRISNFTLPAQGTYNIEIRSFTQSGTGSYTLSLSQGSSSGGQLGDPVSVQPISIGETVNGTLSGANSLWSFSASAGDTVTVAVSSPDFDTVLALRDPNGNEVASNDDRGDGSLNSRIANFTVSSQGSYIIAVSSWGGGTGSFTLSLSQGSGQTQRRDTAQVIAAGDTVSGMLNSAADQWTYNGSRNDTLWIDLHSPDFDTVVRLRGPNGSVLARNDDFGAHPQGGLNSRIQGYQLPTDGNYGIVVDSFADGSTGSYTLTVSQSALSTSGGSSGSSGGGSSSQQVFGVVGQIGVGQSVNNTLQGSSANWALNASSGQTLTIDLTSQAFDPVVRVQRTDGTEVASNDDRGDGSLNSRIQNFTVPAQGQYVITVESFGGGTGSYTLSVSQGN